MLSENGNLGSLLLGLSCLVSWPLCTFRMVACQSSRTQLCLRLQCVKLDLRSNSFPYNKSGPIGLVIVHRHCAGVRGHIGPDSGGSSCAHWLPSIGGARPGAAQQHI